MKFVTTPICCPSRSSILTGLYTHNHKAFNNSYEGGCAGETWRNLEKQTFGAYLHDSNYKTFYAGKYLNQVINKNKKYYYHTVEIN